MRKVAQALLVGAVSALLLGAAATVLLRVWRAPMAVFLGPWWIIRKLGVEPVLVAAAMRLVPDRPVATVLLVIGVSWLVWSFIIGSAVMVLRRRKNVV